MASLPKPGERVPGKVVTDLVGKDQVPEAKVIPWTESAFLGEGSVTQQKKNPKVWGVERVPQALVDELHQDLPDPVRRTARERYENLVMRLTATARITKDTYGYVRWPSSVQTVLDDLGVKNTASEREQVYALAKHYIVKAENQQRRKDSKKVVSDWHGHYD
jgi:hypothetical protein